MRGAAGAAGGRAGAALAEEKPYITPWNPRISPSVVRQVQPEAGQALRLRRIKPYQTLEPSHQPVCGAAGAAGGRAGAPAQGWGPCAGGPTRAAAGSEKGEVSAAAAWDDLLQGG